MSETQSVQQAEATPVAAAEGEACASAPAPAPSPASQASPSMTREACAAELARRFPALFAVVPGEPLRPIKLRVHADIQARAPGVFPKAVLGAFFARHTTSTAYLKALVAAAHRFDLDGQPAGEIAAAHRDAAAQELARRKELAKMKRRVELGEPARGRALPGALHDGSPSERPSDSPSKAQMPPRVPPRPRPADRGDRPPRRLARPPKAAAPNAALPSATAPITKRPTPSARAAALPSASGGSAAPAVPTVIGDPSQRERAALLRAFESSPLSKANFCALKGITPQALDQALALAEQERAARSKVT